MPVTPFHLGIGLLAKGAAPSRSSLLAFVVSQVVIDCETAYFLFIAREWPLHRWAHTFVAGAAIGLLAGVAVWRAGALLAGWRALGQVEMQLRPCLAGGVLGGLTHPILDGVMHSDIQPLRPFLSGNPFLGLMDLGHLHLLCLVAGAVGAALLTAQAVFGRDRRVPGDAAQQ